MRTIENRFIVGWGEGDYYFTCQLCSIGFDEHSGADVDAHLEDAHFLRWGGIPAWQYKQRVLR